MVRRVVARVTRAGYQRAAKPLMFKAHPDAVHRQLVRTGKLVQRTPGVKSLPKLWGYRHESLRQTIHGVTFANPIGLSAGFDKNIMLAPLMRNVGFGFMIGGSVTRDPCDGNPGPWFHRLPKSKSLVVHAGLPNEGHRIINERVAQYPAKQLDEFVLSVSVAKTNSRDVVTTGEGIRDYTTTLAAFDRNPRSQLHEINISCPNTFGGEPFTTPERLRKLLSAVDALNLTKPVFIKMPIDLEWTEFAALLAVIKQHRVQGVTIGNLRKDRTAADLNDPLNDEIRGGLSGLPTQKISTELIRQTYAEYGDKLTIIGVGGVFNAEDAYAKIRAGASLVAMITGVIFQGPQVVGEINRGLVELLARDGYQNISEAIGADHQKRV